MKRKVFVMGLTLLCAAAFTAPITTAAAERGRRAGDGQGDMLTQGEFAQLLVKKLGLLGLLPPNPSDMQCMMILSQNGIFPSPTLQPTEQNPTPGWNLDPDVRVTLADVAVTLVRALGLEDTVQGDKADPQNWLNALQAVSVPTDTVQGGVQTVTPLSSQLLSIAAAQTSGDPLASVYVPSTSGSGLINTITFPDIPSAVQELQDEGMPGAMTPT